jgi:predicted unusual protein kinase regulating ubiquinone biosynthesis (AarF/ABC1/UbiB family)
MMTKGQRYREILTVLARRGVGVVDDEFIKHEAGDHARAEQLRRAFEELGTTFIKLGQVLFDAQRLAARSVPRNS